MSELTLWRKHEFDRMRQEMDQLFNRFRREFGVSRSLMERGEALALNLSTTENEVVLRTELPGINPRDIDISVTDEALTIRAQSREDTVEKGENFERTTKSSKSISRTIALPCRIVSDKVRAIYEDGVLEIVLPKCKPAPARGVKIEIK